MKNILKIGFWLVMTALLISLFSASISSNVAAITHEAATAVEDNRMYAFKKNVTKNGTDAVTFLAVIVFSGSLILLTRNDPHPAEDYSQRWWADTSPNENRRI